MLYHFRKMLINKEVSVAVSSYFGSFSIFSLISFLNITHEVCSIISNLLIFSITSVFTFVLVSLIYKNYDFKIAIRSSFLGTILAIGVYVKLAAPQNVAIFGLYMCIMSVFHYSEFLVLAVIDSKLVSPNSFMINHSPEYTFAAIFSWVEFFLENYFVSSLKQFSLMSYIGCVICIAGEILRKTAMFNAGTNFNHLVQYEKNEGHVLVTSGVYSLFRHPSYVGWFYWSIGTQIVLLNPISVIGYAIASWLFFKQRIFIEEITLLNFFGQQYCDYQKNVGTGIPFIKGHQV